MSIIQPLATTSANPSSRSSDYSQASSTTADSLSQDAEKDAIHLSGVQTQLRQRFLQNPEHFRDALRQAFGDKLTHEQVGKLVEEAQSNQLRLPANIQFVDAASLGTDVFGAYISEEGGAILLDRRLMTDNDKLLEVYAEEYAHFLDDVSGVGDSAGDEGAVFRTVLFSDTSNSIGLQLQIAQLQGEENFSQISLNGRQYFAELYQAPANTATQSTNGEDIAFRGERSATEDDFQLRDAAITETQADYQQALAAARNTQGPGWLEEELVHSEGNEEMVWRFREEVFHDLYWEQSGQKLQSLATILGFDSVAELKTYDPDILFSTASSDGGRYANWAPRGTALAEQQQLDYLDLILSGPLAQELIDSQSDADLVMNTQHARRMISLYGLERYEALQRYQTGLRAATRTFENKATDALANGGMPPSLPPVWNGEPVGSFQSVDGAPEGWGWRVQTRTETRPHDEGMNAGQQYQVTEWRWSFDARAFHADYLQQDSLTARVIDSFGSTGWSNELHRTVVVQESAGPGGDVEESHELQYSGVTLGDYHKIDVIDGRVTLSRQDELVVLDPATYGLHVYDPVAVQFDDLGGLVTVGENIYRARTDLDRFGDMVIAAGVAFMMSYIGPAAIKAYGLFVGTLVGSGIGYVITNATTGQQITLKGLLKQMFVAVATAYINKFFQASYKSNPPTFDVDSVQRALLRGSLEGAITELAGGDFEDGVLDRLKADFKFAVKAEFNEQIWNPIKADFKETYPEINEFNLRSIKKLFEIMFLSDGPRSVLADRMIRDLVAPDESPTYPPDPSGSTQQELSSSSMSTVDGTTVDATTQAGVTIDLKDDDIAYENALLSARGDRGSPGWVQTIVEEGGEGNYNYGWQFSESRFKDWYLSGQDRQTSATVRSSTLQFDGP